ncbi:hypothetical protein [Collimonas sp.]|jgi:hypothetical protein|uniref:hypothetical protein n=1 Tax=Collimonas sp. TaxID=1963772 RepID=UPI002B95B62A|nr:hypothetical protein [Collimonas sp.]HWW07541.1 hypothetical protein [Collimonas sp.]
MWLLPWERWLPPFIVGPFMCAASFFGLFNYSQLHWWELLLVPIAFLYGAYGTWVWFKRGENVFDFSGDEKAKNENQKEQ